MWSNTEFPMHFYLKKLGSGLYARLTWTLVCLFSLGLCDCAFTEYGNRINEEQLVLAKLENQRHKLETRYIIVLNNLELRPTETELQTEKDKVYRKLQALDEEIKEKRHGLDQSFSEWDKKILEDRIQLQMIEKEVKEAEMREPPPEQ
jgi:GTPase involved in cell partitioning and DNA repair